MDHALSRDQILGNSDPHIPKREGAQRAIHECRDPNTFLQGAPGAKISLFEKLILSLDKASKQSNRNLRLERQRSLFSTMIIVASAYCRWVRPEGRRGERTALICPARAARSRMPERASATK